MKGNLIYLSVLVISVAVFTIFICPYLDAKGLTWLCVLFYVLVIVTFLFGRNSTMRSRPRPPRT